MAIINGNNSANTLNGTNAKDTIDGKGGNDRIYGLDGNDRVLGGLGSDVLYGGNGNDVVSGGDGNDRMYGGAGEDRMTGGAGADTFLFRTAAEAPFSPFAGDAITDFSGSGLSEDRIDLSRVFAGTLDYIGYGAFTGVAGQVRIQDFRDPGTGQGNQQVRIDLNGDGTADMGIVVDYQGSFNFQEGDFIL